VIGARSERLSSISEAVNLRGLRQQIGQLQDTS
jgi:hypothetical protein